MTGMIRPAGKRDVTVSITGLDFNTPDTFVVEYLNKFGIVLSNAVVYAKFDTGPFKGKYNGERKYQVDFTKSSKQMGTFHLIDGNKVRVFYRGNRKTCGRCHKLASDCLGEAVAKNCAAAGGDRVFLSDHMKRLWDEIGFIPTSFALDDSDKSEDDIQQAGRDATTITNNSFPSIRNMQEPSKRDVECFDGICLKYFPKTLEDKQILTFLINRGLPLEHEADKIKINKGEKNSSVIINSLSSETVQTIFDSIHFHATKEKFFDVPLYCKPLRSMTPVKGSDPAKSTTDAKSIERAAVSKPKIPGLPEADRLKIKKKKKPKNKKKEKGESDINKMTQSDFLKSGYTGLDETAGFEFTDDEETDEEETDDEGTDGAEESFEDSRDVLSDDEEEPKIDDELQTPGCHMKTSVGLRSTSTPSSTKRPAPSPAELKEAKKTKAPAQSMLSKKN